MPVLASNFCRSNAPPRNGRLRRRLEGALRRLLLRAIFSLPIQPTGFQLFKLAFGFAFDGGCGFFLDGLPGLFAHAAQGRLPTRRTGLWGGRGWDGTWTKTDFFRSNGFRGIPVGVVAFLTLFLPTEGVAGLLAFIICLQQGGHGRLGQVAAWSEWHARVDEPVWSTDALDATGVWPRPL